MVPKFTFKGNPFLFAILFICFLSIRVGAQPYINGNLSTGATASDAASTAAPAGYTWSELQVGNGTTGVGLAQAGANNLSGADDFTVPLAESWNISTITFYSYSTGFVGATSPFNTVRVRIFNTDPSVGAPIPVYGDFTTNRFASSADALMYRIGNAAPGTTRKIWTIVATINTTLPPGHYWVEWQTGVAAPTTSNFSPYSTVVGSITQPGVNGLLHDNVANVWGATADGASGARQDFPFRVDYAKIVAPACTGTPAPGNTLSTASTVCSGGDFTLSLQNNPNESGITYLWQSSPDNIAWTDIGAATSSTYTTSVTTPTYFRARVTCSGNSAFSVSVKVDLFTVTVQNQPADVTVNCADSAKFAFLATGQRLIYQWQQRISAAAPWTDLTATNVIKGVNNDTLVFLQPTTTLSGYQYRVVYTDSCGTVGQSNPATLTVTALTAAVTPTSATLCVPAVQALTLSGSPTTLVTFNSAPLNVTIPDNSPAGVVNVLPVAGIPAGAIITSVSAKINVTHGYMGDVVIILKAPNNSIINLDYYLSGTAAGPTDDGFINTIFSSNGSRFVGDSANPFTGVFRADGVVNVGANPPAGPTGFLPNVGNFSSLFSVPNGNWSLGLYDGFAPDEGQLTSWSLDITYTMPATAVWTSTDPASMFTDAAATVAYTAGSQQTTIYVKPTANTTYTAVVNNNACGASAPTTVSVAASSAITNVTDPSSVSACLNSNASFTVAVGSGSSIAYQWQVSTDGGATYNDIPGANSATLDIISVSAGMNNNYYHAILTNSCPGVVTTGAAILTVISGPNITTQPVNVVACPGGNASFSVAAAGSSNTYQWELSTDGGATFNPIATATSNTLAVNGVTAGMNNNQYHVIVTTCGITQTSANATLTVSSAGGITIQPVSTSVCSGTDATFTATAAGIGFQWQVSTDGGTNFTDVAGATSQTLTLTAVPTTLNGNVYRLVVTTCGAATVNSNPVTLTVVDAPVITVQPTDLNGCEAEDGSISVTATGTGLTYQWQVSTDGGTTFNNIPAANGASLDFTGLTLGLSGNQYRVVVTGSAPCNSVVLISNVANLAVNVIPTVTANVSPTGDVCEGSSITLTGSGTAGATYTWDNGATNGTPYTIDANTTFTVTGTLAGCSSTDQVSVNVIDGPEISIDGPTTRRITTSMTATLTTTTNASTPTYEWSKDGGTIGGATGSSYDVNHSNLGSYTVTVTDGTTGCSATSAAVVVEDSTVNFALITPNPNKGHFVLRFATPSNNTLPRVVTMYNSQGARVYRKEFTVTSTTNTIDIDVPYLSGGTYMLELTSSTGERLVTTAVVIMRSL